MTYFPSLFFSSQVSFKGNYQGLVDLSKTTVGRYSSFWFEHESYKRLYNNHVNACALIGPSAIVYVQPITLCSIAWKEEGQNYQQPFQLLFERCKLQLRITILTDEGSKEKEDDTTEETDRPNVENAKQKRKRKDNRAPKDRRKKQKKESKEVQN